MFPLFLLIFARICLGLKNPTESAAVDFSDAYSFDLGFGLDIDEPINAQGHQEALLRRLYKDDSDDKSKGLHEFTPIQNTIGQSQTQYYSFNVNTSSGLGEYYEFLIFLTGNICSQPLNIKLNDTGLAVYYSFNLTMFSNFEIGQMVLYKNGYFQALADVPVSSNSENSDLVLYIAVRAPENTNVLATWSYEIGVSQNDLVFQWDDRTWASLVDTDAHTALIVTGNLTSNQDFNATKANGTRSRYSLFIYDYEFRNMFDLLNNSWCAVKNGPALMSTSQFQRSYTTRGGALQQQFYVEGLNASTKYVAYLVSNFGGSKFGGAVYQPFIFETMDDGPCKLIYDLEFCDQVAYSVPMSENKPKLELQKMYDDHARDIYGNFSKAIDQVSCDTTHDAIFSPIRTCNDCKDSYKSWLCSVLIPRCTTRDRPGYELREVNESRSDFINNEIAPQESYFEVLPCVNVCQAIVRDCPADFGFLCPHKNSSISLSYYWDEGGQYPSCNYVGRTRRLTSAATQLFLDWNIVALFILVMVIGL